MRPPKNRRRLNPLPVEVLQKRATGRTAAALARLIVLVGIGFMLIIAGWPDGALLRLSIWILLATAIGIAGLEFAIRAGRTRHTELRATSTVALLREWITTNDLAEGTDQLDLFRQVFYDGRNARQRIFRFVILMTFSSFIATAGIIADSTAVVIGAMLIAPLITPMMGMALGLMMGWQPKLLQATKLVVAGIAIAITIGAVVPALLTTTVDITTNTQIVSRSSPTLVDLIVAIAAGAAGSYALARPDISSSLPGVAIAIALVPPLAVVGVLLEAGAWSLATGAVLLFLTNLMAILITGGLVFLATGAAPIERLNDSQHRLRVLFATIAVVTVAVIGALAANGADIARDSLDTEQARSTTVEWLEGSDFSLVSVDLDDDSVVIVVAGPGEPPSSRALAQQLAASLGHDIELNLQWIQRNQTILSGTN